MKKIILAKLNVIVLGGTLLFSQFTPLAFAQGFGTAKTVPLSTISGYQTQTNATGINTTAGGVQGRSVAAIISRADSLISARLTSLNNVLTRIQNDTKLSADQKSNLISQIQSTISGLTTLKTKIDADTDAQTAYTDARQIFTNFRVYEVAEPKTRITLVLNNMQTLVANLQSLNTQLQNLLTTLQSQGKNTSQLTPLVADINTQLTNISTAISTNMTSVQNVTPTTANPDTTFTQVKSDVKTSILASFQKIRSDIEQMRMIFKQLGLSTTQPTPTAGSTITITPPTTSSGTAPIVPSTISPTSTLPKQ